MPVSKNPGDLRTGPGKRVPAAWTNKVVLHGSGMGGPGDLVGGAGQAGQGGVPRDLPAYVRSQIDAAAGELFSHAQASTDAHPASAISVDGFPSAPLFAKNVEAALDELTGRVPPRPPFLGEYLEWTRFTAIPDWGWLKLWDGELVDRGLITTTTAGADTFPYYWSAPSPTINKQDPEWARVADPAADRWFDRHPGNDPDTDWLWNTGSNLTGAGFGRVFAGAFTRDGVGAGDPVIETMRIGARPSAIAVSGPGVGLPVRQEICISGAVFPADRGVLALIHWPAGVDDQVAGVAEFLAQEPLDRVVAAILLGQGVLGDKCVHHEGCGDTLCDGGVGGIFDMGRNGDGNYDPFSYPSQAGGQYNLIEIHRGVDDLDGLALKAPFNDFTGLGDGSRHINSEVPGAGQVRLGTDPASDSNPNQPFGVLPYGIPILGGTSSGYTPTPPLGYECTAGQGITLGNTILRTGFGEVANFFRYRLPYLKDYSVEGLQWTPKGNQGVNSREAFRYFYTPSSTAFTNRDGSAVLAELGTAGHYQNPFEEDFWPWQIARYRHLFMLPSSAAAGDREDVGTYWLVHFKRERDFEAFVRDGIMPWDANDGYELYGSNLVDTANIESESNIANQETDPSVPAPNGLAPDYGMAADSYHPLRSAVLLDPAHPNASMPSFTAQYQYSVINALGAGNEHVTLISGVAYFTPRNIFTGTRNFRIEDFTVASEAPHGFWNASYRTDQDSLSSATGPALIGTPNPMFVGLEAFGYGDNPINGSGCSVTPTFGAPGVGDLEAKHVRRHGFEWPFTYLGSNGSGSFTAANGPAQTDPLAYGTTNFWGLEGDGDLCSFSKNVAMRVYFRRPLGHAFANLSTLPFTSADGHGVVVPNSTSTTLLMHTTQWDETNQVGSYGNFTVNGAGGPFPSPAFPQLFLSAKDTAERFLDEVYRVNCLITAPNVSSLFGGSSTAGPQLQGPGMGGWAGGPIEIPVRIGHHTADWQNISWVQSGNHTVALKSSGETEGLQVSGLPDMNGPVTDGADARFPAAGVLMYPGENFSDPVIRPLGSGSGGTDYTGTQPDYTIFPAIDDVLTYVRTFDVAFSNSMTIEPAEGQPFVHLKFLGVRLRDFAYAAPGPGQQENSGLSIQLKVPGLTTWMDVGRVDGGGPSKQDAVLDGAGCQVVGSDTFDGLDPASGMVYCQVKCNVGPAVNLFKNIGAVGGNYSDGSSPANEVPVMIKVTMRGGATNYDLMSEHDGNAFVGPTTPGTSLGSRRGLVRMEVLRLSEV